MKDPSEVVIECDDEMEIVRACNIANAQVPLDIRKRLNSIFSSYLRRYDVEGVYERLRGRTIAQVFAEFQPEESHSTVASGEVGGLKYQLFEAPGKETRGDGKT